MILDNKSEETLRCYLFDKSWIPIIQFLLICARHNIMLSSLHFHPEAVFPARVQTQGKSLSNENKFISISQGFFSNKAFKEKSSLCSKTVLPLQLFVKFTASFSRGYQCLFVRNKTKISLNETKHFSWSFYRLFLFCFPLTLTTDWLRNFVFTISHIRC